jgi:hypothetical protein
MLPLGCYSEKMEERLLPPRNYGASKTGFFVSSFKLAFQQERVVIPLIQ